MNGYVAFYAGSRLELYAASLYEAKQQAIALFGNQCKRKKVKPEQVTVWLAEIDGSPVVHRPDF